MIPVSEYGLRRSKLFEKMAEHSVLLVFAGSPKKSTADEFYNFEVNRNFYYLTGIDQEESALLLVKAEGEKKEYLFVSPFDPVKEKWYGKKLTPEEAEQATGVHNILMRNTLTAKLDSILKQNDSLFGKLDALYLDLEDELKIEEDTTTRDFQNAMGLNYPGLQILDCYKMIVGLRMVKSVNEVAEHRKAIADTYEGIKAVMAQAKEGVHEYELADTFHHVINDRSGYQGVAFNTIMASGKHAACLHYPMPRGKVNQGDLLLMDLGSRNNYYNADITRTVPTSGKFNPEQKALYEIVLGANKAVANYAKPGVSINDLQNLVKEYMANELIALGYIKNKDELINYYFHGVSHHVGLDTHDPMDGDRNTPLVPGNIISDEPGLYFAEKGIGIRIEDDLLITEDGCEVLSKDIIKEIKDLETFYQNRK